MTTNYERLNECTILEQGVFSFGRILDSKLISEAVKTQTESLERKFELEALMKNN